jgi:type IV secretory pathway VirB2 component (pilin)
MAQGILYLVVGSLAVQVATGDSEQADQKGALRAVLDQPAGRMLLGVLVVGLALHSLWRVTLAIRGEPGSDEDAGEVAKRIMHLGRAVVAASLTAAAAKVWFESRPSDSNSSAKEWTARVLEWNMGPLLVGGLGVALAVVGCWHLSKAFTHKFLDDLDLPRSSGVTKAITALGGAGWAARGSVYALVGWFLFQAARDHDANQAAGIDESLKRLLDKPAGPVLLGAVAVGLALFGIFRIIEGALRRPAAVSHA